MKTGRPIRELVLERGLLDAKRLDEILSVDAMTRGGIVGAGGADRQERQEGREGQDGTGRTGNENRQRLLVVVAVVVAALPFLPIPPVPPLLPFRSQSTQQPKPPVRLFPPQDLGLLEGPDRDQWQKPEQIMDALGIAEGSIVADLGAGGGWFTIRLARRVLPNGIVYAEDIQPQMIEDDHATRAARTADERADRCSARRAIRGCRSGIDAVLIVDAYHEMEDPVALLKNVARSLKPQGRIGIVDFNPGGGGPGPEPEARVNPQAVIDAAAAAGLQLSAAPPSRRFSSCWCLENGRSDLRRTVVSTIRHSPGMTPAATSSLSRSGDDERIETGGQRCRHAERRPRERTRATTRRTRRRRRGRRPSRRPRSRTADRSRARRDSRRRKRRTDSS